MVNRSVVCEDVFEVSRSIFVANDEYKKMSLRGKSVQKMMEEEIYYDILMPFRTKLKSLKVVFGMNNENE